MNMLDTSNLSDEENATSSEEDEAAEMITDDLEMGFLNVFSQLKNKDPQIYKEDVKYFPNKTGQDSKQSSKKKSKQIKPNVIDPNSRSDNFWTSKNLSEEEKFLRDYILNKKFLGGEDIDMEEELMKLREEEKELEEEAIFEYKFNNRYEEKPDEEFTKKYPNTLGINTKGKRGLRGTPEATKFITEKISIKNKKVEKFKSKRNTEGIGEHQSKNKIICETVPQTRLSHTLESSPESINAIKNKKEKKNHKDNKDSSKLGTFVDDIDTSTRIVHTQIAVTSINSSPGGEIVKQEKMSFGKRKLEEGSLDTSKKVDKNTKSKLKPNIDQTRAQKYNCMTPNGNILKKLKSTKIDPQSTKDGKNVKISLSVPNNDQIQTHIDKSKSLNGKRLKKDKGVERDNNKTLIKKEIKTKTKLNKKVAKVKNSTDKAANKLKKMLRYKSRRKKPFSSTEIKSNDKTLELVKLNKKLISTAELTVGYPESENNKVTTEGKKRKRSRRKPSGVKQDISTAMKQN